MNAEFGTRHAKVDSVRFADLPVETQELIRKAQIKGKISEQYHKSKFGNTSRLIGIQFCGRMMVSVGSTIYHADSEEYDWESPCDFLVSYLKSAFGIDWLNCEFNKDRDDMHEVAKWFCDGITNIEPEGNQRWDQPNGKALALLHLAYDLYILENIGKLPNDIFHRMKNIQNFNGARYELFVFATLIRAGFSLDYCDEKSGTNGRVAECIATHPATIEKIYVEAKTRNVRNVLGSKQGKPEKIHLYDKLKDAIEKNVVGPYLVFVDINHPGISPKVGNKQFEKVRLEYKKLEQHHKKRMPNIVCFTNIPFHYGADDKSPHGSLFGLVSSNSPKHNLPFTGKILSALNRAVKQYPYIPKEFSESDVYAEKSWLKYFPKQGISVGAEVAYL